MVGGRAPSDLERRATGFQHGSHVGWEKLSRAEIKELLAKSDGLALVRGRWVEIDAERLKRMIEHFGRVEQTSGESGLSFAEAMRMLAGPMPLATQSRILPAMIGRKRSQVRGLRKL